ncbi:MAG: type II toxin-antitoxin system RelE/ParE family toxin [Rhodoferax sp.]
MPRLIWSPPALRDVQRLYRFLEPRNPDAARRAVRALREGVRALGQQARLGRPVEGLPEDFREWVIDFGDSGYLVRYRVVADTIVLLAVRHQKEAGF